MYKLHPTTSYYCLAARDFRARWYVSVETVKYTTQVTLTSLADQSFSAACKRVRLHMGERADSLLEGRVRLIK